MVPRGCRGRAGGGRAGGVWGVCICVSEPTLHTRHRLRSQAEVLAVLHNNVRHLDRLKRLLLLLLAVLLDDDLSLLLLLLRLLVHRQGLVALRDRGPERERVQEDDAGEGQEDDQGDEEAQGELEHPSSAAPACQASGASLRFALEEGES